VKKVRNLWNIYFNFSSFQQNHYTKERISKLHLHCRELRKFRGFPTSESVETISLCRSVQKSLYTLNEPLFIIESLISG